MGESQFPGVQHQAWAEGANLGRCVQRVAQHGVTNALQVHAQLVCSARHRLQFQQGGGFAALQGAPAAAAGLAVGVNDVDRAVFSVQQNRPVNAAPTLGIGLCVCLGMQGLTRDHRQVALVNLPGFKQAA